MQNTNKFYYLSIYLVLIIFSFFVNFYYSSFGIEPVDSFVLFNGGFKVLNGLTPFKDYWLVTGPLMDYLNAFFFKLFDVSWKSYVIHSSLTNTFLISSKKRIPSLCVPSHFDINFIIECRLRLISELGLLINSSFSLLRPQIKEGISNRAKSLIEFKWFNLNLL